MSRMKLDAIVVVDIETTCWDTKPAPKGEIIEIGATLLDLQKGPQAKRSILVTPRHTKVSEFCTKLTTLTQKDIDGGTSLQNACNILLTEFDSKNRTWASYGDYDRKQFQDECRSKGVDYPFGPRHINVKNLFAVMKRLPSEVGLDQALILNNMSLEGTHHRGGDDSWNIAKILWELLKPKT